MLSIIFQVLGGWVYGHLLEYSIHRFLLHGPMKRRGKIFSFHFAQHHKNSRRNKFRDDDYKRPLELGNAANKELLSLALLSILHTPLAFYMPWFFCMSMISLASYYYHHYRGHKDPNWAKNHIPWHYDHHMGKDQDSNYGVRSDFFDKIFNTRKDYSVERKERYEKLLKLQAKHHKRKHK